jgi:UDP-apiose/xylose synthase
VLGCGGYIGSHLLDSLLPDPSIHVVGFDPDIRKIAQHLGRPNFKLHRQYLNDDGMEALASALEGADAVINLAAICNPSQYNTQPLATIRSNCFDVYPVIELCAARRVWLVHFSTSEVYGRTLASYVGDTYADPELYEFDEDRTPLIMGPIKNQRWTYACAKQLMERFIYAQHKENGLPFNIVRPLNFFGPRMDFIPGRDGEGLPRVLACFLTALLDGKPMELVDGGTNRRTITSIHDAIRALRLILERPERAQNQIFNIGNRDNEVTIAELARLMRRIYAEVSGDARYKDHPIVSVSSAAFYGEGYEDCDRRMPKIDKARELLGWEPRISLEDTLRETIAYYYALYGPGGTALGSAANGAQREAGPGRTREPASAPPTAASSER